MHDFIQWFEQKWMRSVLLVSSAWTPDDCPDEQMALIDANVAANCS